MRPGQREWKPDPHVAVVPGIYSECFLNELQPLASALENLNALGYETHVVKTSGNAPVSENAVVVRDAITGMNLSAEDRLLLVGYSKGVAEILEAVTGFEEARRHTVAVLSIAGAVAGSPIAEALPAAARELLSGFGTSTCMARSGGIQSVSRRRRLEWLASHELPASISYFSVVALPDPATIAPGLLATYKLLASVGPRNDGALIFTDAVIPRGTLLGYLDVDHWNVVYRFPAQLHQVTGRGFPQEVMLESSVRGVEDALARAAAQ